MTIVNEFVVLYTIEIINYLIENLKKVLNVSSGEGLKEIPLANSRIQKRQGRATDAALLKF